MIAVHIFKRWESSLLVLLLIIGTVTCSGGGDERTTRPYESRPRAADPNRVSGEYIVFVKQGTHPDTLKDIFENYTVIAIKDLGRGRFWIKLKIDPGPPVIEQEGMKTDIIKHIQPNYIKHFQLE